MQSNSNNQSPPSPPHPSTPSPSHPTPLTTIANASSLSDAPPDAMRVPVLPPPLLPALTTSSQPTATRTTSALSFVDSSGRTQRVSSRHQAAAAAAIARSVSGPATASRSNPTQARQRKPAHSNTKAKERADAGKWVVEKIIDEAITASGTIYYVKWKGYAPTWEVYDNVKDCQAFEIWQQHRSRLFQVSSASQSTNSSRRPLPTQCPLCSRTFNQGKGLVAHLNNQHTPIPSHVVSSLSLLPCPHCKHFYQSLHSHQRHCTAERPAAHSFRSNPPQQQPHTSLADAFAATSQLQEHKAEKDNKEVEFPSSPSPVYNHPEQKTEKENKQNHHSVLLPPIPDLPVSEFATETQPPCSPLTPPSISSLPPTTTPVLEPFGNIPVCCICQSSNSIIDDSTETFPLPCCQHPVHLPCVIEQSHHASTCPACRVDLAHKQLHPSFTMPPTHQRVNEAYANDMSIDEISRIQQQEQNEHQGTDAATLDLLHAMLNDDTSLSGVPLVDVQLPPEVAIPSGSPSSPRRVSFDLSSNTLHVHTNTELITNTSINFDQQEHTTTDSHHPHNDDQEQNVEFHVTLNNSSNPLNNNNASPPPSPVPSSSLPSQLPSQYSSIPHLWRTMPKSATSSWIGVCRTVLQQALTSEKDGNIDKRDEAFSQFILLPRQYLNRVAKQRNAARKLAKNLHFQHSTLSQPQQTQASAYPHQQQQQPVQQQRQRIPETNDVTVPDADAFAAQKAARLVREGHVRRAVTALLSTPSPPITTSTLESLHQLHPPSKEPFPPLPVLSSGIVIDATEVASLPYHLVDNGSAPGPSGWTGALLIPLLRDVVCCDGLARLLTLIINGQIEAGQLSALLLCARLVPVTHPDNRAKIRPITIGEIIYRIAGLLSLRSVDAQQVFPTIQLGINTPGGIERALHKLQAAIENHTRDNTIIALSTDIKNAFNTCSRARIFTSIATNPHTKGIVPIFHWSHCRPTPLLVYNNNSNLIDIVYSREGVRQGDPLASMGFGICMQPIYETIQQHSPSNCTVAIQDDLTIIGPYHSVFAAYDRLEQLLATRGDMQLQPIKCRVLIPSPQSASNPIQTEITSACRSRRLTVLYGTMPLLGSSIGIDDVQSKRIASATVAANKLLLKRLLHPTLPSQIAYHILKQCIITKVGYLSHVTRPELMHDALRDFDIHVLHTLAEKTSLPLVLSPSTTARAQLPVTMGGLGLRSTSNTSPAAFFSSVCTALPDIRPFLITNTVASALYRSFYRCHAALLSPHTGLQPSDRLPANIEHVLSIYSDRSSISATHAHRLQHHLIHQIELSHHQKLLSNSSIIDRAQLRSASSQYAGLHFIILPNSAEHTIITPYFNQAVRLRLNLPPHDMSTSYCDVQQCGKILSDTIDVTHHHYSCRQLKRKEITFRHDLIVNTVLRIARDAGYATHREPRIIDDLQTSSQPDATLYSLHSNRQPIFVDVSVTHPCAPSYVHAAGRAHHPPPQVISDASSSSLTHHPTIKQREHQKINYYAQVTHDHHAIFYPLVMETYGATGEQFIKLLSMLASDASEYHQHTTQQAKRWLFQARCSIAIALQVGNAIIAARALRAARTATPITQQQQQQQQHPTTNNNSPFNAHTSPPSNDTTTSLNIVQLQHHSLHAAPGAA